jgi:hypothetical protein
MKKRVFLSEPKFPSHTLFSYSDTNRDLILTISEKYRDL